MKLVIFDVDGTLVDSQNHIVEAQRRAFAALALPPPTRRASLSVVGLSLVEAFTALVGPEGPAERLVEAYKDAWTDLRHEPGFKEALYPGAGDTIAALRADPAIVLGVATGKSKPGVARMIAAQDWAGVFATIQTADGHPSKPDPSMIHAALRETGRGPEEAMMIGDTVFDMDMAAAAGVRAIGVTWGYHAPEALRTSGADRIVETFEALRSAIAEEG